MNELKETLSELTMYPKRCPKIILEGTRLTNKTEIAFALHESPQIIGQRKYRYHFPLISAEWDGFTNSSWGRGLLNFGPSEEKLAVETYQTWLRLFELQPYIPWIIDRFHISTRVYQLQNNHKDYDFCWLEERMAAVGFRLVFCTRTPQSFEQARQKRLKISSNAAQYDDLEVFVKEQEIMRNLIGQSLLPTLTIDISDDDVASAVDSILLWLVQTGGFFMHPLPE